MMKGLEEKVIIYKESEYIREKHILDAPIPSSMLVSFTESLPVVTSDPSPDLRVSLFLTAISCSKASNICVISANAKTLNDAHSKDYHNIGVYVVCAAYLLGPGAISIQPPSTSQVPALV